MKTPPPEYKAPTVEPLVALAKKKLDRYNRRKHSRYGNIYCPICAPCRCSKAR